MDTDIEKLKYPIGNYKRKLNINADVVKSYIDTIEALPEKLRMAVKELNDVQLDTQYRLGGWTIRQVVHHLPDSHLNAYIRMKLAVTEDKPAIKTYDEAKWAELPDAIASSAEISLMLVESLHKRWVIFLRALTQEQLKRTLVHPELGERAVDDIIGMYAWHGEHHLAHIKGLIERMSW
jgi:hypothetical protein